MKTLKYSSLLCLALATTSFANSYLDEVEREDQSIPVAGMLITPLVKLTQGYDSNVASEPSEKEVTSWYTIFQPSVKLVSEFGEFGKHNLQLDWTFTHGAYHASGDDSYNDHDISGKLNYEITQKHRLMFQSGYINAHEERGSRFSIGLGSQVKEPDLYEQIFAGMRYTYGAETADARLELETGYLDNNYRGRYYHIVLGKQNLEHNTKTRNRFENKWGGTFYYRVGSATDLTLEAWHSNINYNGPIIDNGSTEDNDIKSGLEKDLSSIENKILVGAKWEASALTTGFLKLGFKEKDFDLKETIKSTNNFIWEAEVLWEPKTYSKVKFTTSRDSEETNGQGFFFDTDFDEKSDAHVIKGTSYAVEWKHQWRERLSSKIAYAIYKDIYKSNKKNVRTDNNTGINANLYYDSKYWLSYSLEYAYTDRDSKTVLPDITDDIKRFIYDRHKISFGVRISLF